MEKPNLQPDELVVLHAPTWYVGVLPLMAAGLAALVGALPGHVADHTAWTVAGAVVFGVVVWVLTFAVTRAERLECDGLRVTIRGLRSSRTVEVNDVELVSLYNKHMALWLPGNKRPVELPYWQWPGSPLVRYLRLATIAPRSGEAGEIREQVLRSLWRASRESWPK